MHVAWPLALLGLLVVPMLGGYYVWQLGRRRKNAVRYSSVALLRDAGSGAATWRRHLPAAGLLGALALLGVATARPQAQVEVPLGRTTIMLALDVSGSMCATDVEPNRLSVAQDSARAFIADQPDGTRIGIVAFSNSAQTLVAPTTDRDQLTQAVDTLTTSRGTAIGAAILQSIESIAEINPDVPSLDTDLDADGDAPVDPGPSRGEGDYVPDIVVLLTDGSNTRGIEPLDAAPFAVERGVRVYTIGFGTTNPAGMSCTAEQLGSRSLDPDGGFGGGGGGGGGRGGGFLLIDEPVLREVAALTGGTYHLAEDAEQLLQVFTELPRQVEMQTEDREITSWFALAGAALAAAAIALSLRRTTV